MGSCASKSPRKPNPYVGSDASKHLQAMPQPETPTETPLRSRSLHLKAAVLRRYGSVKPSGGGAVKEGEVETLELEKNFDLSNKFASMFEVGEQIGRGRSGYTCSAVAKKGELKGRSVAVKIIPKSKIITAVAIDDVRREVKILQTLTGHPNLAQFYGAFEDADNVYIVMELCKGGGLLERMLARGGKYSEDNAKAIIIQILNAVAFLHLHGVVHRDVKPENFLFTSKDENQLKAIDFAFSEFVRPDENLNDIIGCANYIAPEVFNRSYDSGADLWSAVLDANPDFSEKPWPSLSPESKDFVRCLLRRDPSQRISAVQALSHPWLQKHLKIKIPLDILIFKLMRAYMRSSYLRKAALRALSRTLTVEELYYLKEQFALMLPDERGGITLETMKMALIKNAPGATKSHVSDLLEPLNALQYRRIYFEEFCAAALSVTQLGVLSNWEERTHCAYEKFEQNGNRVISVQELASELGLSPSMTVHDVLQDWVRQSDGKLTFLGFVKLLRGQSTKITNKDNPELEDQV